MKTVCNRYECGNYNKYFKNKCRAFVGIDCDSCTGNVTIDEAIEADRCCMNDIRKRKEMKAYDYVKLNGTLIDIYGMPDSEKLKERV